MEKSIQAICKNMNQMEKLSDYQTIFELMNKYDKLPKLSKTILNYLWNDDFQGNYTDFTKALGLNKKQVSNVTKALKYLEKLGIVYIIRKHSEEENANRNNMKVCFIVDGWLVNLLNTSDEELTSYYKTFYKCKTVCDRKDSI